MLKDMTKPDPELKEFFRVPEHFADLFNGVCFGGEQVLNADELVEIDTDVSGVLVSKVYRGSVVRNRDVLKKVASGTRLVIFGVENQNVIDYTMPLRVMVYDGLSYTKELKNLKEKKKDALVITPVITIVVYYGKSHWDGPKTLKGMMREIPSSLENMVSDYKMNLVEVLHDQEYYFENENVRMLFEYSQAIVKKDKKRIAELDVKYHLNEDVIYAIGKFVDIREAKEKLVKEAKEEMKMCELFDDIREEGKEEGREEGRACGTAMTLRMLNYQAEDIIIYLIDNLKLTREEAMKYI